MVVQLSPMTVVANAPVTDKPAINAKRLEALEAKVDTALRSYVDAGLALQEIKESRGYLLRGYESFEAYTEARFGWEWRQAQRQIAGANTALLVEATVGERPRVEAVARELAPVMADAKKAPTLIKRVQAGLKQIGKTIGTANTGEMKAAVLAVVPMPKSNGHNGHGHNGHAPAAPPAPKLPDWVRDVCPHCGETPESYQRLPDGWWCGGCQQPVRIGVIGVTLRECPNCAANVASDAAFCPKCGEAL